MTNGVIQRLVLIGGISIIGILFSQTYWLIKAYKLKDTEFHQTITIALNKVATSIALANNSELPKRNIVQRKSSNYYLVNINDHINPTILEDNLVSEFEKSSIDSDFEYAVYDCLTSKLAYGNYCRLSDEERRYEKSTDLPTFRNLDYYFVVKFPNREGYLLSSISQNVIFASMAMLALGFFIYSIWVILKQKKLSALQKDFINNMTHEFKTPISSIKIAADVLKNEFSTDNTRLSNYVQIIIDQNARLNNQVEKVLNLAKLENQEIRLQKKSIDLKASLNQILDNEELKCSDTIDLNIQRNFSSEEITLFLDPLHFNNIVSNILDNAIKYSRDKVNINVDLVKSKDEILLKIGDNGIGLDTDHINKIFTKFYRVPRGNLHDVKGFGLGLYYVKTMCEAHNWGIMVDSELHKGTCFTIRMPVKK